MRNQNNLGVYNAVPNQLADFEAQENASVTGAGLDGVTVRAVTTL